MKDIYKIYDDLDKIRYGWVDKDGNKHYKLSTKLLKKEYILQSPDDLEKSKIGLCLDQVEYERQRLESIGMETSCYMIYYDGAVKCRLHTFLVFIYNNNDYYLFEHAWESNKGIHKYNSLMEIFEDVKNILIKDYVSEVFDINRLHFYKYTKPDYNINYDDFLNHCLSGCEVKYEINC